MPEVVEGGLCSSEVSEVSEVPEVKRCVLLCMLEAVEGWVYLLEALEVKVLDVLDVLKVPKVLDVLDVLDVLGRVGGDALCGTPYNWRLWRVGYVLLEVLEVMRCVLLCMLEAVEGRLSFEVSKFSLLPQSRCTSARKAPRCQFSRPQSFIGCS